MRTTLFFSLCLASLPLGFALAGGSPAYLAERKSDCTMKGKLSQVCFEFWQDVVAGDNTSHVSRSLDDDLRACWREAKDIAERGEHRAAAAEKLLRAQAAGEPGMDNKYVAECIRLTGEVMGGDWAAEAGKAVFLDKLQRAVNAEFEAKCGTRADVQRVHGPLQLVMWGKGKGKAVVWEGEDPAAGKLAVRCDGYIVGKTKDGKPVQIAPTTIAAVRGAQSRGCISECQMNDPMCVEGQRRGKTTPLCARYCADKCR